MGAELEKGRNLLAETSGGQIRKGAETSGNRLDYAFQKNNPDMSGYFNVNFISCLIALLITQSAHREYSSVNSINDIYSSIILCCWFEAQFCHKMGECFICLRKHGNLY